jgi:lipopolysaccharide biosynthesis protein
MEKKVMAKIWSQFHSVIDCLITRPNEGFDFGSWAAAINSLDLGTKVRGRLVLMNNSVYGPFRPLSEVLSSWNPACEILGMTSSNEFQSHVQSYFLGFRSSACSSSAFRDFWNREFHESNKWLTIVRSEMRWAQYFERNRFSICVKYTADRKFRRNPLTFRWFELLREGMPFLKKSLFSQNYDQIDLTAWEEKLESLDSDFPISAMKS